MLDEWRLTLKGKGLRINRNEKSISMKRIMTNKRQRGK